MYCGVSVSAIHKTLQYFRGPSAECVFCDSGCCIILLTKVRQALTLALMNSAYVVAAKHRVLCEWWGIYIPNVSALLDYLLYHTQHNVIQVFVSIFSSINVLYSFPCHAQHLNWVIFLFFMLYWDQAILGSSPLSTWDWLFRRPASSVFGFLRSLNCSMKVKAFYANSREKARCWNNINR